jgi:hypothetical protein
MVGLFGHHSSRGGQYEETEDNLDEIAFHFAPATVLLSSAVRLLESICDKDNGSGAWRQPSSLSRFKGHGRVVADISIA